MKNPSSRKTSPGTNTKIWTLQNIRIVADSHFPGNIGAWGKKVGDSLAPGDVLCEIETGSFIYHCIIAMSRGFGY